MGQLSYWSCSRSIRFNTSGCRAQDFGERAVAYEVKWRGGGDWVDWVCGEWRGGEVGEGGVGTRGQEEEATCVFHNMSKVI